MAINSVFVVIVLNGWKLSELKFEPQNDMSRLGCGSTNEYFVRNDFFSNISSFEKIFCYMIILKIIWKEKLNKRGIKVCKSKFIIICLKVIQSDSNHIFSISYFNSVFLHLGIVLWWMAMFFLNIFFNLFLFYVH